LLKKAGESFAQRVGDEDEPSISIAVVTVTDLGRSLGDGVTASLLPRSLANAGHKVFLVAPQPSGGKPAFDLGEVETIYTPDLGRRGLPRNLITLFQIPALVRTLFGRRPDVVYVRASALTVFLAFLVRVSGKSRLISEFNAWHADERLILGRYTPLAALERLFQVWEARLCHGVRVVIPDIAEKMTASGVPAARIHVIGNASDTGHIRPMDRADALRSFGLAADKCYLGFVGHFTVWQGLTQMLHDLSPALRAKPDLQLLLVGDGGERKALEKLTVELRISGQVNFLGVVPYARLPQALACIDVALLPTAKGHYQKAGRSPVKLRDYAAAGKLVVAADIPVIHELANEPWIWLYRIGEPATFGEALDKALEARAQARGAEKRARAYAEENFSWQTVARALVDGPMRGTTDPRHST